MHHRRRTIAQAVVSAAVAAGLAIAFAAPANAQTAAATVRPSAAVTADDASPTVPAATPPMGFNDWNAFGCNVDEQLIEQTADFFVSSGLKAAGYEYVNIDDCWLERSRSADGHLVPDPVKFPDGIKGVADYVHSKGLKLGIYEDAGTQTCAGYPGSLGHEQTDADDFAAWGVDYLKYDNCNNQSDGSLADYEARYKAMHDALAQSGRSIVFSMCEWGVLQPWTWADKYASLWRTTGDISDNWGSLKSIISQNLPLDQYAHPGAWNDPDMLEVGNGGMTDTEYRTHFAMWAEMAAPLLIGTDLRKASAETLNILTNERIIAVDQDPLGVQGAVIAEQNGASILSKPLANGDRAIALYNPTDRTQSLSTTAAAAGLAHAGSYRVTELWSGDETQTAGTIAASVPAHGTAIYRVSPNGATAAPSVTLTASSDTAGGAADAAVKPGGTATLTSVVTNNGRRAVTGIRVTADVPDGWSISSSGSTSAPALASGQTLSDDWTLTAPSSAEVGTSYPVSFTVTYRYGDTLAQHTVKAQVQVATAPPAGTTPLSDVPWSSTTNSWGPVEKDLSNGETGAGDGKTITINGQTYSKGFGTNATSDIDFFVGGTCSTLTTDVGIDDEVNSSAANATFRIIGDGKVLADSGPMTAADAAKTLTADLNGVTWLSLYVDNDGSNDYDHADWAGPVITCS
jgi:alpha-galactosidase